MKVKITDMVTENRVQIRCFWNLFRFVLEKEFARQGQQRVKNFKRLGFLKTAGLKSTCSYYSETPRVIYFDSNLVCEILSNSNLEHT